VLVAKYFYDSGLVDPHRLDVVVFKYPKEPQTNHIAMNYIKRLIGLPGETIGIYYGKLYVLSPDRGPQFPEDLQTIPETRRWEEHFMHRDDPNSLPLLLEPKTPFELVRKPPQKMLAMRRIVFDNDYQPHDLKGRVPPRWADDNGSAPSWLPEGPSGFRHPARSAEPMAWLRYRHILREGPEPELITDFMGYNTKVYPNQNGRENSALARNWVGDLLLECEATVEEPTGELVLELAKGVDRFQARWDLTSGTCSLWRLGGGQEVKLATAATAVRKKGTYHLRFANVDERLTVWVNEKLPFGDGKVYDAPGIRRPMANDLQPASIGIQGGGVRVQRLQLWRDTYYTVAVGETWADAPGVREILQGSGDKERRLHELLSQPDRWGDAFANMPGTTMFVQPGHYLCLGDNSPESSDGRSWGLVPNRLLLGRALLVYWPLGLFGGVNRAGPIR
jgi:signal peptidase I